MTEAEGEPQRKWRFYRTSTGAEKARREFDALPEGAQATLLDAMARRSANKPMRRDLEHVGRGIWSLRATYDGCEYRILHSASDVLLALVVLDKRSKKLRPQDIENAERRLKDWEKRAK